MNRKEKLQALKALKEGRLMPEDLRPEKIYLLAQKERGQGEGWEYKNDDGIIQDMTDAEYQELKKQVAEASHRRELCGLKTDKIICLIYE
jgi:hypothetical protein